MVIPAIMPIGNKCREPSFPGARLLNLLLRLRLKMTRGGFSICTILQIGRHRRVPRWLPTGQQKPDQEAANKGGMDDSRMMGSVAPRQSREGVPVHSFASSWAITLNYGVGHHKTKLIVLKSHIILDSFASLSWCPWYSSCLLPRNKL